MADRSRSEQVVDCADSDTSDGFATSRPSRVQFKRFVSGPDQPGERVGYVSPTPHMPHPRPAESLREDELPPTRTDLPATRRCGK